MWAKRTRKVSRMALKSWSRPLNESGFKRQQETWSLVDQLCSLCIPFKFSPSGLVSWSRRWDQWDQLAPPYKVKAESWCNNSCLELITHTHSCGKSTHLGICPFIGLCETGWSGLAKSFPLTLCVTLSVKASHNKLTACARHVCATRSPEKRTHSWKGI